MVQKNELLGSKAAMGIARFFVEDTSRKAYAEEIRKATGMAKATVIKGLRQLEAFGVVRCEQKGRTKYYGLSFDSPLTKRLLLLILLEELVPAFKGFDGEVYLYGSLARGEPTKESDIDLLIITERSKKEAYREIHSVEGKVARKISPTIVTAIELSRMARHNKGFYKNISTDRVRIR